MTDTNITPPDADACRFKGRHIQCPKCGIIAPQHCRLEDIMREEIRAEIEAESRAGQTEPARQKPSVSDESTKRAK